MPITKSTSAGEIIKDFVRSKNPKFSGDSKKKRKQRALAAFYGMHNEALNPGTWKVRMHQDKQGRGMFTHVLVKAASSNEARDKAGKHMSHTDYKYSSSAKRHTPHPDHLKSFHED